MTRTLSNKTKWFCTWTQKTPTSAILKKSIFPMIFKSFVLWFVYGKSSSSELYNNPRKELPLGTFYLGSPDQKTEMWLGQPTLLCHPWHTLYSYFLNKSQVKICSTKSCQKMKTSKFLRIMTYEEKKNKNIVENDLSQIPVSAPQQSFINKYCFN